jgi:dTDP-4-amino-4,6-dideoxygalactose transaminase
MIARVPLADLAAQHAPIGDEIAAAMRRVVASSRFILGPEVLGFEAAVAEFLEARHAIGVSSGTDALLVALWASGVRAGDEVVTTPFTFFATVEAIQRLGARPRFVDVDPATLNLDVQQVAAAISSHTRAIVPVHLYGSPVPTAALCALGRLHGVRVVEDAAQAFGARDGSRAAGTSGDLGCFSFFPSKVLGALGDGGLIVTGDDALAARCRRLRHHGSDRRGEHLEIGGNFRLDALQAAVLSIKLKHVPAWTRARREHALAYDAAFRGVPGVAPITRAEGWNGAIYTLRVEGGRRDALRAHLDARGVETAVYYDRPLHLQPALAQIGLGAGAFPESERAAAEVLSLPIYPEMSADERETVIDAVRGFGG